MAADKPVDIPGAVSQNGQSASPFAEIGTTGLKRFGGDIAEEFDPNLRGIRGVRVYDEMRRNDPDIGAILYAIQHIALAATWAVEPASDDPADEDAAEFLRTVLFEDMSHSWRDFVVDMMTSNIYGWAYFELVFKQRLGMVSDPPSLYDDGRIGLRKLGLRGQESLMRWEFDEHGGIRGLWQRSAPDWKSVFVPIEKAVLVRTSKEKNNPEGISLLRNAYRPYYTKVNIEEIEVIGAERDMTGVLKIYLPQNADDEDKRKAQEMGERYRADDQTYFLLQRSGPDPQQQWDVDVIGSGGTGKVDTDKTIMRSSVQITRSVLAQFLTLGQGKSGGSFALGRTQKDLFHLAVKGLLDTHTETINRFLVRKIFALNEFQGITGLPKVTHSDLGDVDLSQLSEFLAVVGNLGLIIPTPEVIEHLHKRAGLPAPPVDQFEESVFKPVPEPEDDEDIDDDAPKPERIPTTMREWGRRYLR